MDKKMEREFQKNVVSEKEKPSDEWIDNVNNPLGVEAVDGGYKLNNRERRARSKYFSKMLKENAKDGSLLLNEEVSEEETKEKMENRQARLRAWYTRKSILERKLKELSDPNHVYGDNMG